MYIHFDEIKSGIVEIVITSLDIHNNIIGNSNELEEIIWELFPLLGCKEQISLYINHLYLIIINNIRDDGGYEYGVIGRFIKKYPFLSPSFYLDNLEPENCDVLILKTKLIEWIKEIRTIRRQLIMSHKIK